MSHFQRYSSYKDSDVEWIGPIPAHWSVVPFSMFVDEVVRKNTGLKERNLLSLSYGRLVRRDIDSRHGLTPDSYEGYNIIEADDIVFRLTDLQNDQTSLRSARALEKGIITSAYVTVRPRSIPRYFEYLMRSYDATKVFYAIGGGIRQSMKFADLKRLPVVVPPLDETDAVADYLDRETARIDALISKKVRLIELLKEKRQALITNAITKGINPTAKTKVSAVAWIGKIPQHWDQVPIKRLIRSLSQGWSPECESRTPEADEWGVLKVGCVNGGVFRPEQSKALPVKLEPRPELSLKRGDVLVSRANSRELVGSCAVVPRDYPNLMLCDKLYRMSCRARVTAEFLAALISVYGRPVVEMEATGTSASMVNISQSILLDLRVALPGTREQNEIMDQVAMATGRVEAVLNRTERSLALLQERRSSLITAAVTGQIDLRKDAEK